MFSLALALSRWSRLLRSITVLNFFTESAYAPQSFATSVAEISRIREREDRAALASICPKIRLLTLGLLDAPLRLNVSVASITAPFSENLRPAGEIEALARVMRPHFRNCLVMAPLALGNHIDHRTVYQAALESHAGVRLGFYEDLPYATWTSNEELTRRVADTEAATKVRLTPILIRDGDRVRDKFRHVRRYRSQITRGDAQIIARFASRFGSAERIWVPRFAQHWQALLA